MLNQQNLNGAWDFYFTERPLSELDIASVTFNDKAFVPGCFDAKGKYRFLRGTGLYRKKTVCGGKIRIEVQGGAGLRGTIFWDGKKIGEAKKPFTAETFLIESVERGEHELIIAAENTIDESPSSMFHEFYDFYGYGGIYRDLVLTELPSAWLECLKIVPQDLEKGIVEIEFEIAGDESSVSTLSLSFDRGPEETVPVTGKKFSITRKVPNHKIWSLETPHLHSAEIRFGGEERKIRFGIRKVEVKDGRILLNGEKIKLVGFNRHDSHPDHGYAVPDDILWNDLEMIHSKGYNLIRGCHYPQSETMLDFCDELGILVWDESLAWGNTEEQLSDPVFFRQQIEQTKQMIRRSFNHPSIILWGFLNEARTHQPEGKKLVEALVKAVKEEDSSRLVTFASALLKRDISLDMLDVISFNTYPGWYGHREYEHLQKDGIREHLRDLRDFASQEKYKNKGLILSEIGAASLIGDHSGLRWSEEYQAELLETVLREIWDDERWSGVAFWHFADTKTYCNGVCTTRPRGFNNKGVVNEYRNPKLAWERLAALYADLKKN